MRELYSDQLQVKRELYHNFNNGIIRQVLGAPTGSGKTVIAVDIMKDAISRGKKPLFLVDRITLAHQSAKEFRYNGLNVSVHQGANTSIHWDENCIVGSIHTLKNKRIPECDLILIDECHINHKHYREILNTYDNVKTIGLSATPESPWLGEYFETIVKAPSMGDLIELGRLVPFRVFSVNERDLSGVRQSAGKWVDSDLSEFQSQHVADPVNNWIENGEDRKTIAFAVDINHAKVLADEFRAKGVEAMHIDCYMKDDEVAYIFHQYEHGPVQVLISVGKLTTGFDSPKTSCIIDDAPTQSMMRHIQKMGRGPRKYDDTKKDVLIFDHTTNCLRLGHPALYEIPDLRNGKVETKPAKKTYKCRQCNYIGDKHFKVCPQCGAEKMVPSDDYRRELGIDRIEAELEEMEIGTKANKLWSEERKLEFYRGLLGYAKKKAYKPGYADIQYKSKFGVWCQHKGTYPLEPNEDVKNHIKYMAIKRKAQERTNVTL